MQTRRVKPAAAASLTLLALLALPGSGAPAPAAKPTQAARPDRLIFSRHDWLFLLPAEGGPPKKLIRGNLPSVSPDEKKVAYLLAADLQSGNGASLRVLDLASGKSAVVLATDVAYSRPQWSPDGSQIAFVSYRKRTTSKLEVIGADGSGRRVVIEPNGKSPYDLYRVDWAPDGKSLFFQDLTTLFRVSPAGEILEKTLITSIAGKEAGVTSGDVFVPCPTEPQVLACTLSLAGPPQYEKQFGEPIVALYLYDAKTKKRQRLTPPGTLALLPVWSRDGKRLYFYGFREPQYRLEDRFHLYRIGRDGKGLTDLGKGEEPAL